jgi:hypothetical protein
VGDGVNVAMYIGRKNITTALHGTYTEIGWATPVLAHPADPSMGSPTIQSTTDYEILSC